jgi:hypothetical protein
LSVVLPPIADIVRRFRRVRCGPLSDIHTRAVLPACDNLLPDPQPLTFQIRETLAKCIIEMARRGEKDKSNLVRNVVARAAVNVGT